MDDVSLPVDEASAARSGLMRLHEAVLRREPSRAEASLSPEELLVRFRTADPTRNGSCLPWLLRTYAAGGYRLEDLSKAHDTLVTFARLRGLLPNTATIDGETRNPRKLGSHVTLASLWKAVALLVEEERLVRESAADERVDEGKERALEQSRVLYRSVRLVIAVPMTEEASCWWGQGTQWCTAARKNNAFEYYHKDAPLIVVCLRKNGNLPARKLQLYVYSKERTQFMDENDAPMLPEVILERWEDLADLIYWGVTQNEWVIKYIPESFRTKAVCISAVSRNGLVLKYVPEHLRTEVICMVAVGGSGRALEFVPEHLLTEAICTAAVGSNGLALEYVPEPLRTEAICSAAVGRNGWALQYVPEPLRTEAMCLAAVSRNGWTLQYVPEHLRTEEICTVAVGGYGRAIVHVPERLLTEVICLAAVGKNGWALEYIPVPLRTEAICLAAVGSSGDTLYFVPEPLRTEAICTLAVAQNGYALQFVPKLLCTEAICLVAVENNEWALAHVPNHLRTEAIQLVAKAYNECKTVLVNSEIHAVKSHDLVLVDLENHLNK